MYKNKKLILVDHISTLSTDFGPDLKILHVLTQWFRAFLFLLMYIAIKMILTEVFIHIMYKRNINMNFKTLFNMFRITNFG